MNRKVKYFMPFMALLTLVSCNHKTTHSSTSTSHPTPTSIVTPSSTSTSTSTLPPTSEDDVGTVNLTLDFSTLEAGTKRPNLGENWTSDFTYTYDKAIVFKKTSDYILTPPFVTDKAIEVIITGFLEKGTTADDKLVVTVQGIGKDGKVIEEVTLGAKNIQGTKEAPVDLKFSLKNSAGNIGAIKIGLKETGRASNFGITKLVVTSK